MVTPKEIHAACVIAYLDSADTAVRNAIEDGQDIILTDKESLELRESLNTMQGIIKRLMKKLDSNGLLDALSEGSE